MVFPYPQVRASQAEMIADVRNALENRSHIVADAPTGLGKTVAALFPAIEHATKNQRNVLFLTSRLSQHRMAVSTMQMIREAGCEFSAVDIVGKRHLCSQDVEIFDASMFNNFCSSMIKDKKCEYYRNFYRKDLETERAARLEKLNSIMSVQEAVGLVADRYCAYEMLMEAAKHSVVVVGDYFHLFGMSEKFLRRMGKVLDNTIIIVDEAHNLAPRLRSYMSSRISTYACDIAKNEAADAGEPEVEAYIKCINDAIKDMAKKHLFAGYEAVVAMDEFVDMLAGYKAMTDKMHSAAEVVLKEKKKSSIERIAGFLDAWKGSDTGYARILSRVRIRGRDHIVLQYNCLDPSLISKAVIGASHSTILMSGTLSPMEMHRDLLGMDEKRTIMKSYPSPFPKHNRKNIIVKGITTKYTERTPENFARIAATVRLCAEAIKGNAAVFFPSYEIRDTIYEMARPAIGKHVILENSKMTKEGRDRIMEEMKQHADKGALLFGVMGGSFSEGIDLPGNLLNGVIIVGLPLEKLNLSVKALIDYYDERFGKGIAYGYTYPAMIKVIQSAGRCIRSESDRGVIVFADERFTWSNYSRIFPRSWNFVVTSRPEVEVRKFFGPAE
ncbi:MAG: ATP-dependent DNA helicase [Candidatus Aenigmarchaeota archaeon]|nr:ATP-dependent DNA helicase [Candidatus Aenigmarchaeota archaeon]